MQQLSSKHPAHTSHMQHRGPGESRTRGAFTTNGDGAMTIPQAPPGQLFNGQARNGNMIAGTKPFDIARSPPNPAAKNTKHVPCKFFRQGTCQAGAACPFLHSTDTAVDTAPCKYFAKGNCKFGAKCLNAHILPDGRRVNRPNPGMGLATNMNGGPLDIGGRVEPPSYVNHDSALANSILTQQQYASASFGGQYFYGGPEDMNFNGDRYNQYQNIPSIETGLSSNPGSKYGSPVDDSRLPVSPVGRHLTALDAPLPASFDSNGISNYAKFPSLMASSVPAKFGMESPPASSPQRAGYPGDAFRSGRSPVFGSNIRNSSQLGSSPPATADESIGHRLMHSQNVPRPRLLSASLPRSNMPEEWDEQFTLEDSLLPRTLHDDVLAPDEKRRRFSRAEVDLGIVGESSNALRIPSGSSSKVGSPLGSSPSRFSALFAKQREKKEQENGPNTSSGIGHVGSPLRETVLPDTLGSSPGARPFGLNWPSEEQSAARSAPSRNTSTSVLSQQLGRMHLPRIDASESNGNRLQVGSARNISAPTGRFDRTISSPGLSSTRIDEEQTELVFSMDDEGSKRSSRIWGGKSPNLRPLGEQSNGIPSNSYVSLTSPIPMDKAAEKKSQRCVAQGMFSVPRVCSRCLGRILRTAAKGQSRLQSTATTPPAASISPTLLARARSVAAQYAKLAAQNAESYDVAVAKKIGELGPVTTALKDWQDAQHSLAELQALLSDPSSDTELRSLASTDITTTTDTLVQLTTTLKRSLTPPHPFAHLPCLLELHPGAGGSEASLFAASLLNMYRGLCARRSWPATLLSYSADESVPSGETGLTDCVLEIDAPGAYDVLRTEAGVHRVQRVPATEKKGRTHTSAVSVLVLPSLPKPGADSELNFEDPNSDYYVDPGSVRSETMRARGAGGQHVNKTDSAIRLTHTPTGIVVAMQESRSQHKNRERAWQVLRARLAQKRREEREDELIALRRKVMGGLARTGREDKVRTYNYSQNRVTDHRCGSESSDLDGILGGGASLEGIMDDVREWMVEGEMMALAAEEAARV